MVGALRRVLVKRPDEAFAVDDPARWHYASRPDLNEARREHDALVEILIGAGAEVIDHPEPQPERADAIFVFDPALVTDRGAVILRMGKELRRGEEEAMARRLREIGVPILAELGGEAVAEGGDLLWLDSRTLAVGQGFRTNAEGLRQLREILAGVEVLPVELPYFGGPEACLHLLSLISIVDRDLAVIYPPLLPVTFWRTLRDRGFRLVEVPEEEFPTMAPNVLALAPRKCLMLEGNPVTRERLERAGCEVLTYRGREISLKAEGGPTCLTRPIWRSPLGRLPGLLHDLAGERPVTAEEIEEMNEAVKRRAAQKVPRLTASGKSLREFAQERIFTPLGMSSTQILDDHTQVIPRRAASYAPRSATARQAAAHAQPEAAQAGADRRHRHALPQAGALAPGGRRGRGGPGRGASRDRASSTTPSSSSRQTTATTWGSTAWIRASTRPTSRTSACRC